MPAVIKLFPNARAATVPHDSDSKRHRPSLRYHTGTTGCSGVHPRPNRGHCRGVIARAKPRHRNILDGPILYLRNIKFPTSIPGLIGRLDEQTTVRDSTQPRQRASAVVNTRSITWPATDYPGDGRYADTESRRLPFPFAAAAPAYIPLVECPLPQTRL